MTDIEMTTEEKVIIEALKKLEKRWPKSLWLFSASGTLYVMRADSDGGHILNKSGGVDPDYCMTRIDIPNDGGDW